MTENTPQPTDVADNSQQPNSKKNSSSSLKPGRDNVLLIIAIVVAALNFIGVISAIIAFNWLSVVLGLLNTIVWTAVIIVQLRRGGVIK